MEKKMTNWRSRFLRNAALVLAGCGLVGVQLCAQEQKAAAPKSSSATAKNAPAGAMSTPAATAVHGQELTATDLSAFLDGLIPQQIEKADIAGAVVAVVKDGKVLFEKGYGYSDAEKKTPVSPQDTLFRPGSISKTLKMTRAPFRQRLPESLKPFMSNGYDLGSGKPQHFEWVEVAPAGSLSASAESMAHWMIMHLQNGRYGDAQILKPETAIQMHARQDGWPASMNAMCLGFYEQNLNGHRVISHGGDTELFHSDLFLILDSNVGLFVSYNSAGRPDHGDARGDLYIRFMDRYFPAPAANETALATAKEDAHSVAGPYKISRRFETNILAVTTVLDEAKIVADPKDNTIYLDGLFKKENGQPRRFREIAPMLFKSVDGPEKVAFVKDSSGHRVCYLDFPFMVLQEVDVALDKQAFNYVVMGLGIGVVVLTILFWPVSAILRKHYKQSLMLDPPARKWRRWAKIACIIDLIYLLGFLWTFTLLQKLELGSGGDFKLHLLQVIGVLGGVGGLLTIICAMKSWTDSTQWVWYKVWNTLLAVGCVGFFWFLVHWHLLNFSLNY